MSYFYRASTPTHVFRFPEAIPECPILQITYKQGTRIVLEKFKDDITISEDGKTLTVTLTQNETKEFLPSIDVLIQLRGLSDGGEVFTTKAVSCSVIDVLNDNTLGEVGGIL